MFKQMTTQICKRIMKPNKNKKKNNAQKYKPFQEAGEKFSNKHPGLNKEKGKKYESNTISHILCKQRTAITLNVVNFVNLETQSAFGLKDFDLRRGSQLTQILQLKQNLWICHFIIQILLSKYTLRDYCSTIGNVMLNIKIR